MPPLIVFAGVLGGLAMVRWAYRAALMVNQELEEVRLRATESRSNSRSNEFPTLRQDPITGAYRPS